MPFTAAMRLRTSLTCVESTRCAWLARTANAAAATASHRTVCVWAKYAVRAGNAPQSSANAGELEVVRDDGRRADGDEREQPPVLARCNDDPDRDRTANREGGRGGEHSRGDSRLEWASVQLVQRVRADSHREQECEHGQAEQPPAEVRCERSADRNVRQMPERVRRMQQRHVIAPAAGCERVERGARAGARRHARRPQTTIPPPRLMRRARTSAIPAARHNAARS